MNLFPTLFSLILLSPLGLAQLLTPNQGQSPGETPSLFDPAQESVSFGGQTFILQNNNIHVHFESYLNSQQYQQDEAQLYYKNLNTISALLTPDALGADRTSKAFKLLKKSSRYRADHNVSESLSSAVSSALNAMDTVEEKKQKDLTLKAERIAIIKKIDFITSRTDLTTKKTSKGDPPKKNTSPKSKHKELLRRKAEIDLLLKNNRNFGADTRARSRLEFQAILIQLFTQRRFEHVIIGCDFYLHIFENSSGKIELRKNSKTADFFQNTTGVPPTIVGLETYAKTFIEKVHNLTVQSKNHIKRQELHSASDRLLEAFAIGEHLSYIQTLPFEFKQQLYQFNQQSNKLSDAIDARDFDLARSLNNKLKDMAVDYRHTKSDAYIDGFVNASDQHMVHAFTYFTQEDQGALFKEVEHARSLWPLNPKIKEMEDLIKAKLSNTHDTISSQNQCTALFDKLLIEQRYLEVISSENWANFNSNFKLKKDPSRLDTLNKVMDKYEPAARTLTLCDQLLEAQQSVQAWEKCYQLNKDFPNNETIGLKLQECQTAAASYVDLLTEAQQLTKKEHYGSALSCYLKAQSIQPDGAHAKQGISDLSSIAFE